MRKIAISLLALFLLGTAGVALGSSEGRSTTGAGNQRDFNIIPVAGLAVFSAATKSTRDISSSYGITGGVLVDLKTWASMLKFETGLIYIEEGDSVTSSSFSRTNVYMAVPALVKLTPVEFNRLSFYGKGGLTPALLLDARTEVTGTRASSNNAKSYTNDFDLQATAGLGMGYLVNEQTALTMEVTYMQGLVSFLKDSSPIYNKGFMVTGGVVF